MLKETTHRANELKDLGWTQDDVTRYAELWDYRQRWGAINLEREDRLFLKKAEAALPDITKGKSSVKKPIHEKSYYRRLLFFLEAMKEAEKDFGVSNGSLGIWAILMEEELRAIQYYQPVLGLPDTLKAKKIETFREQVIKKASELDDLKIEMKKFDFDLPLEKLKKQEDTKWKPLRDEKAEDQNLYPILEPDQVTSFRKEVRNELVQLVREVFPSLSETDKPVPPDDWKQE